MKFRKLFFGLLLFITTVVFSQEIVKNETTEIFEYSHVKEYSKDTTARKAMFLEKLNELNYSNIKSTTNNIKAESFFSKNIMGTAMEVHYNMLILFRDGKYKLIINKFTIKDQRYGVMPLENLKKSSRKRWVKFINTKLPKIIINIENTETW